MKPKSLLALLAALTILFSLSSCDWFTKNPDDNNTTTAAGPADPTDPGIPPASDAVMAPIQGGPMLYTFRGREAYAQVYSEYDGEEHPVYPIGLVDQDGKLVSAPVYHNADYIYDEAEQRVIGLAAVKGREITIYELDGTSRVLPVEGFNIEVFPGGRYATVNAAQGDTLVFGGWSVEDPLKDGLYDLESDSYLIEPKAGQMLNYKRGGAVMCYQYNTTDATGDETAQWIFLLADGSTTDLPLSMGHMQDYYPETGWIGGIWTQGEWEQRVYDKDLNIIKNLTGWSVDSEGFGGGEWCMIYNNNAFPGVETWVNRQGELSDKRFGSIYNNGWRCYFSGENFDWQKKTGVLFDSDLNAVCRTGQGEHLAALQALGGFDECFALMDAGRNLKAVYDLDAKPMRASAAFRCWQSFDYDVAEDGAYTLFAAKDGQWTVLDLGQFQPTAQAEDSDGVPYANPVVVCEDYIVVETGVHWYEAGIEYNTFAIDWQGEFVEDCPLAPFIMSGVLTPQTAGEQGPNYYWIELQDGEQQEAKRGYINLKGEWLFVDEG